MKHYFLAILMLSPVLVWGQNRYRNSLSLNLIQLGIQLNYERAILPRQSLMLSVIRDNQWHYEKGSHWAEKLQFHYRFHLGAKASDSYLSGGPIIGLSYEYAHKRLLQSDVRRAFVLNRSAPGLKLSYRFLWGKRRHFMLEPQIGVDYRFPHLVIPDWFRPNGQSQSPSGWALSGALHIGFVFGPKPQ